MLEAERGKPCLAPPTHFARDFEAEASEILSADWQLNGVRVPEGVRDALTDLFQPR